MDNGKGKFIVFEGLDGSGKTTQLYNLKKKLHDYGIKCHEEREPSDGIIGLLTRGAVTKKMTFQPETLALLFAADRFEHVTDDILPELERGVNVLCDRFVFSNLAYQSVFISMEKVYSYNQLILEKLMPDLTFFIDVPPEICEKRLKTERTHFELFEGDGKSWQVRENFFKSFEMIENANVKIIDGTKRESVVFDKVWDAVRDVLNLE